jgi:hypothetical protein
VADVVERYLTLGLQLGRHVDGLVDSYYGPPELAEAVKAADLVAPDELAAAAAALADDVACSDLEAGRKAWLADQIHGVQVYAGTLAGDEISYSDEIEGCYGVRPELGSEAAYTEAHEQLDELLPGAGRLYDRYESWRREGAVPTERIVPALLAVADVLRAHTNALVELPGGEQLTIEEVHDEPWWAFNYYQGDLTSRIVMNSDVATEVGDIVTLAAHEAYPGHHTERAAKEERLVREQGFWEEAIQLVPTPQSLVSEGIAEYGLEVLLDGELVDELEATLAGQGLTTDLAHARAINRARQPFRGIGLDVGLLIHEHGVSTDEAAAHYERWALAPPERAASAVRFATDPTWRAYAITYSAGRALCARYVRDDPSRFATLLTEQVRVADLLAAQQ